MDLGAKDYVFHLTSGFGPGRRPGLIAVGAAGASILHDDGRVEAWRDFPFAVRALTVDRTTTPHTLLAVAYDRSIRRFDGREWSVIPGGPLPLAGNITGAHMMRYKSGECALLVGTNDGLAMLRTCGGSPMWRLVRDSVVPALRSNDVTALSMLASDAAAVGTAQGLALLYFDSTFAGGIRVARSVTDADGLPHSSVMAIGPIDGNGRLWVGTTLGLGFVNIPAIEQPRAPVRITAVDMRDGRGQPVANDARIPEASARLDVGVIAPTHHREDETQFRFELDGAPLHATPWTDQATVSLVGVAAGTHTLRVRARDFDGRESDPLERRFTVERPWWRTFAAVLLYAGLLMVGVFAWVRSRRQAVQRSALSPALRRR